MNASPLESIAAIVEADLAVSGDRAEFRELFEQARPVLEAK